MTLTSDVLLEPDDGSLGPLLGKRSAGASVEQLAEAGQTEAVARIIGERATAGQVRGVGELVREALASVSEKSLDSLGTYRGHPGEMSLPRAQEVAAAINRVRPLRAAPKT